jgi:DNA-binding response OmpR family regulator
MNGREVLQAIRNHGQLNRLPVVLFSTSSSVNDKVYAERHDAFLITKPVDFANLEVIVEQFIERCNFEVNNVVANSEFQNL